MDERCKHDINWLLGTGSGVICRRCGKRFPDFAALKADLDADRAGKPAKTETPAAEEKPKEKKARKGKKKE
jgi:hypothetical protein